MNPRQFELIVEPLICKMDHLVRLVGELSLQVSLLPNVTHEIVKLTEQIRKDTADLHGQLKVPLLHTERR